MFRRVCLVTATLVFGLGLGGAALAGGWAITRIDEAPSQFEAGVTYEVRYTILQHGRTPAQVEDTSLIFTSGAFKERTFPGRFDESRTQYVAEVTLPEPGSWRWRVSQGWFNDLELGVIEVAPAGSTVAPASSGASGGVTGEGILRMVLPLATLLALGSFIAQLRASGARPSTNAS